MLPIRRSSVAACLCVVSSTPEHALMRCTFNARHAAAAAFRHKCILATRKLGNTLTTRTCAQKKFKRNRKDITIHDCDHLPERVLVMFPTAQNKNPLVHFRYFHLEETLKKRWICKKNYAAFTPTVVVISALWESMHQRHITIVRRCCSINFAHKLSAHPFYLDSGDLDSAVESMGVLLQ